MRKLTMNFDSATTSIQQRRAFLHDGALYLLAGGALATPVLADDSQRRVRFGLMTDLHYADKATAGSRHYRETPAKLEEAATQFFKDKPDHVVELGDLIDAADSVKTEQGYLRRINKDFTALPGRKHYVLGNHCVHTLTKQEFLDGVERKKSFYSFDAGGFHFVVLDACFRSDGQPYGRMNFKWTDPNIPGAELEWLTADLAKTKSRVIVFVHQRLDVANNHGIKNAPAVRRVLERSGKVLAVFQGHSHQNDLKLINGIHYCVHRAMIEGSGMANNGYSTMDVLADGSIRLQGFRKQKPYSWNRKG